MGEREIETGIGELPQVDGVVDEQTNVRSAGGDRAPSLDHRRRDIHTGNGNRATPPGERQSPDTAPEIEDGRKRSGVPGIAQESVVSGHVDLPCGEEVVQVPAAPTT